MKKQIYIVGAVLFFAVAGVVMAMSLGSTTTLSTLSVENLDIRATESPVSGSLVDTLLEADFQIDEDGNVNIPNLLTFGDPPVAAISTDDAGVRWSYGIANIQAGGVWVDSHPIEAPDGATCAIVNPYDNVFGNDIVFDSAVVNQPNAYTMWPGSGSCIITKQTGTVASCVVESIGYQAGVRIRALDASGGTATSANGTYAEWKAGFTRLPAHTYSCGIVRDPAVDMADILQWKLASLDADRVPDDQFFIFVNDENGEWFNEPNLCASSGCPLDDRYQGLQVAWFVWKTD